VIDAAQDALTPATSLSYWVAAAVMGLAGLAALLMLRYVRATDAPGPDHNAPIPAPRGVHVGRSQA
jgi:hypothetical protein